MVKICRMNLIIGGLALLLSVSSVTESKAASIEMFNNCGGFEMLTDMEQETVNSGIDNLNPKVIEIFNYTGGSVEFVDSIEGFVLNNTDTLDNVYGIYLANQIQIRPMRGKGFSGCYTSIPIMNNEKLLPHELGHMLFNKVRYCLDDLDSDILDKLKKEHEELNRIYGSTCANIDESFAVIYSLYVTGESTDKQSEIAKYIENVVIGLYDEYMRNGGQGPF